MLPDCGELVLPDWAEELSGGSIDMVMVKRIDVKRWRMCGADEVVIRYSNSLNRGIYEAKLPKIRWVDFFELQEHLAKEELFSFQCAFRC